MPSRTVLRVDSSVKLSDIELQELAELNGVNLDELKIEKSNLATIELELLYKQRFESICNGAKFLLDNLPLDFPSMNPAERQALSSYIVELEGDFIDSLKVKTMSSSDYTEQLYQHSCLLTAAFALRLEKDHKTAVHMLSKGEEYYMLTQPRDDLMTLTKIENSSSNFYILQADAQQPAFSDDLIDSYWSICQSSVAEPKWFKCLEPIEQYLLKNVLKDIVVKSEIPKLLINLSSRLRSIPGVANFRNHIVTLYNDKLEKIQSFEQLASSMISSRDVQKQPQEIGDFHALNNLNHIADTGLDSIVVEKKISEELNNRNLSSGDRVVIEVPILVQTLISPIIPPFLQPDYKLVVDKERAIDNFVFEKEQLRQVSNQDGESIWITAMIQVKCYSTNHSLNLANRWDYTQPDDKGCNNFIKAVQESLKSNPENSSINDINELLMEYDLLLKSGNLIHANFKDSNMRELFLSSLEQLIAVRLGWISYGSCVSAKDRKALELAHTNAMEIYRKLYGSWPKYSDEKNDERVQFVNVFVGLYVSRHHQNSAALNAPGSEGIKTPHMYLPSDMSDAIEASYRKFNKNLADLLNIDDILASMNEFRTIVNSLASLETWSAYDEQVDKELNILELRNIDKAVEPITNLSMVKIINQYKLASLNLIRTIVATQSDELKEFWNSKTGLKLKLHTAGGLFNYSRPDGVKLIDSLFDSTDEITVELCAKVFKIINHRLATKSPYSRASDTKDFYKLIELMYYSDTESDVAGVYQALRKFHKKAAGEWPKDVMNKDHVYSSQSGLSFFADDENSLVTSSDSLDISSTSSLDSSEVDSSIPSVL